MKLTEFRRQSLLRYKIIMCQSCDHHRYQEYAGPSSSLTNAFNIKIYIKCTSSLEHRYWIDLIPGHLWCFASASSYITTIIRNSVKIIHQKMVALQGRFSAALCRSTRLERGGLKFLFFTAPRLGSEKGKRSNFASLQRQMPEKVKIKFPAVYKR